ncbi:YciI family protein [Corynebacterium breve]|uniref:YciI family protein n=1 Tax=Corynebacterium breve TaxID=3049799 RepID=A0ABY8VB21_9CORY|nr:YciI family protein [Corynebacterium breve]WIM66811.1 YciI family protein [Corynebacterium breve]
MKYFAVHYTYANEDENIVALRPTHREFLGKLLDEGKLVGSGPYTDGLGSALIIIRLDEPATVDDAAELMDSDPFHTENALAGRSIREWNPVMNVFQD